MASPEYPADHSGADLETGPETPGSSFADLLFLASLHRDAGKYDRMDIFLDVAADTVRQFIRAREVFVLFIGDGEDHLVLSVSPDAKPLLGNAMRNIWQEKRAFVPWLMDSRYDPEAFLVNIRTDLLAAAARRGIPSAFLATFSAGDIALGLFGFVERDSVPLKEELREMVVHALSVSIGNFRMFSEARQHLARQSFLREVGRVFATGGSLKDKIRSFLDRINLLRGVDGSSLMLLDDNSGELWTVCATRLESALESLIPTAALKVVQKSSPVYMDDLEVWRISLRSSIAYADNTDRPSDAPPSPRLGSYLGIPLLRRESVIGVLNICNHQKHAFRKKDIEFYSSLSEQIALHIENAALLEQTQQQLEEITFVFRASTILRQEKTLTGIMQMILEQCVPSVRGDMGYLFFYQPLDGRLVPAASWGAGESLEQTGVPVRRDSYDYTDMLLRIRYSDHPELDFPELFRSPPLNSFVGSMASWFLIPLRTDQGILGLLLVGRKTQGSMSESERRLLLTMTNVAENAIGRTMAFEEKEARAREEAASRAKSEFLAVMSHELRTPLTAILGFSEVLLAEHFAPLQEKQREYLQDILQNGNHLLSLINDVLDLAKVEARKMDVTIEEINLREIMKETIGTFAPLAERKDVVFLSPGRKRFPFLRGDRRHLKQILFNLLSNAVKFTDPGGRVEIHVGLAKEHVLFRVSDTGIGIAREDHERIFQPFSQVRGHPGRAYEGTGLGLSLTRRLVELHGGRIWVESDPGRGSTFHVVLPREGAIHSEE
jgi:signal transduction histidine kinase